MFEENNIFSLRLNILAIFIGRKIAASAPHQASTGCNQI
jgi:hypothetical protein